ncbi:ATP-dependent helicase [Paenibacillus sp. GD4]|uniref:UvrD-helicase domain-containing protein n=1 Tax=Paenibacillus sp. GD4 TaxID=3068890 RepID=UPI00279669D4|nr:ATP-dependent helicase [Paenibacillus sp. GD4]MDQ1910542.1 ATP-dependent helicase [Paenibacillus sp. GD4]
MEELYSELLIARGIDIHIDEVYSKVISGTKMILLTDCEVTLRGQSNSTMLKESMLYQVHIDPKFPFTSAATSIKNGLDFNTIKSELAGYFPTFNQEQYEVEHADPEGSILITAGAGSGKTTVMVQRILFLLKHVKVEPSSVAMITFTREAAKNMFEKLREALYFRFQITGDAAYLKDIEHLNELQISTIDSFLYRMFKNLGGEVGLGSNFTIKNFKLERRELIEREIDAFLNSYQIANRITSAFKQFLTEIRDYELIRLIDQFWADFEKRGVIPSSKEVVQKLFGPADEYYKPLQDLIVSVITACHSAFLEEQLNENAVTLSYLSSMLDQAVMERPELMQQIQLDYDYLFIDEFQDSSDFQIRLAQRLAVQFQMKLFVVGDVKQSIYRFRGADDSAFEKLLGADYGGNKWLPAYSLQQNYRSSKKLLEVMDQKYFSFWGSSFSYTEKDRLISNKPKENGVIPLKVTPLAYEEKQECKGTIISWMKRAMQQAEGKQPKKHRVAVLTRTRKEARLVAEWCASEKIPFHLDIGGTLFESPSARDLNRLLHALLFTNEPAYACEYLMSPYSSYQLDPSFLFEADGNPDAVRKIIDPYLTDLKRYQKEIRRLPILSLLRLIINESEPVNRYYELLILKGAEPEEAKRRATAYELNLTRIMDLMVQSQGGDHVSLPSILNWLQIQIKSNREEDEPKDDIFTYHAVNILTVHRAKGLEYHTVVIPFTDRFFHASVLYNSGIIFNKDKAQAGWKIRLKVGREQSQDDKEYTSPNFNSLQTSEQNAIKAEELRLLYVAMTRAEQQLWIVKCTFKPGKECWAKYLPVYESE